jgi:hypothetical protein
VEVGHHSRHVFEPPESHSHRVKGGDDSPAPVTKVQSTDDKIDIPILVISLGVLALAAGLVLAHHTPDSAKVDCR